MKKCDSIKMSPLLFFFLVFLILTVLPNVNNKGKTDEDVDLTQTNPVILIVNNEAYVDQYITGFYGRGQLAEEKLTENQFTEQNLTSSSALGSGSMFVEDGTKFFVGSILMIKYDDGTYFPHFISAIKHNEIDILPRLQGNVSINTSVERGWYNSAHPGKFYMRYIAQRLAADTENSSGYGIRVFYRGFDTTSNYQIGVPLKGATTGFKESQSIESSFSTPLESCMGTAAFFTTDVIGGGIRMSAFSAPRGERLVLRMFAMSKTINTTTRIAVKTLEGIILESIEIEGVNSQIMLPYVFDFLVPSATNRLYIEVSSQTAVENTFFIDEIQVLRGVGNDTIISGSAKIIGFGDSWVAGDLGSTTERESLLTHLQDLLPNAEIINKGVGGNTVLDLLARFETGVVPFNPDVVIVHTATNDAYNPASLVFDPTAVEVYEKKMRVLINMILEIGAMPIVISPPALAEEDGEATNFLLNDRSRAYANRMSNKIFRYDYGIPYLKLLIHSIF